MIWVILSVLILLFLLDKALGLYRKTKPSLERCVRLAEQRANQNYELVLTASTVRNDQRLSNTKVRVRTDEFGFLEPSLRHASPDLTIVFLGDSVTESTSITEEKRFPFLVGKNMERVTGMKVNAINAAVSMNNVMHSNNVLINKVIPLAPGIVVLSHGVTDLSVLLIEGSYWNKNSRLSLVVEKSPLDLFEFMKFIRYYLFPNLADIALSWGLFDFLAGRFRYRNFSSFKSQKRTLDKEHVLREFRMALDIFVSVCKIHGFTPVIMTQANRFTVEPDPLLERLIETLNDKYGIQYADYQETFGLLNAQIRDIGSTRGVPVVDLDRVVPRDGAHLYDAVHLTERGSILAADTIAKQLLAAEPVMGRSWETNRTSG